MIVNKRLRRSDPDIPRYPNPDIPQVQVPLDIALEALQDQYEEHETCHVCHFLATILTAGLWFIPWMVFAYVNADRCDEIYEAINKIKSINNEAKESLRALEARN